MKREEIAGVILAAGKGTRMRSLRPKVIHEIAGLPMISYVAKSLAQLNPKKIISVVSDGMEEVGDAICSINKDAVSVIQGEQLGTAHAVSQALSELQGFSGIVFILYGDTPFIKANTLRKMVKKMSNKKDMALVILGFTPDNPAAYGRLILDDAGELEKIIEFKDATQEQKAINFCNSGVIAVRGDLLPLLLVEVDDKNEKNEFYLTDIVAIAKRKGLKCGVIETKESEVMGINSKIELAEAERIAQDNLRRKALENGVTMIAPETVFLSLDTEFGKDVTIHPNVVFGEGVKIGDNVEIKSFSHIEGAVMEEGAVIGPFARIRPATLIGENAKVGNFVEIKNSRLAKNVKASHLSYIGDTDIARDVNIGAGTVTCNYDGYNKSKTTIGEGAFIGSNTSLVAPVTIGKGAIIGAGSTITKDVTDDSIAFSQRNQKELSGKALSYRNLRENSNG